MNDDRYWKNIEDFVIIDGEKILKDDAIKTEPVSEETLAGWQQSFEDYQRELKKTASARARRT